MELNCDNYVSRIVPERAVKLIIILPADADQNMATAFNAALSQLPLFALVMKSLWTLLPMMNTLLNFLKKFYICFVCLFVCLFVSLNNRPIKIMH